jgi:acyl dehydratase
MPEFKPSTTVRVDDAFSSTVDEITRAMFIRYAGASGDFNPIHWDRDFTRGAGYDDVFGMGMFTAGLLSGFLSQWLGRESVRRLRFRFVDQVWAGEHLIGRCRVAQVYPDEADSSAAYAWADCELSIENEQGKKKITAWATCAVHDGAGSA